MKPLVSVIIPNYNYAGYLGEAIDSVLSQTYPNVEVIVVDDGSTDGSREIIENYGDRIAAIFQQNQGVAAARNNGVRQAAGDHLAFLDADDVWLADKIERQIILFDTDKTLGLVHVGVQDIDENGDDLDVHLDGMAGEVSHELLLMRRPVVLGGGSGLMVTRSAFDAVGGFDLRLSTSADWDLFYQISSRFAVGFVNEVLLKYRMHGSNMHGNIARMETEMLIGFEKAFADSRHLSIERAAYGNLYQVLAGSHFRAGNYPDFVRNSFKSIVNKPSNLGYFAKFPLRSLKRDRK